MFYERMEHEPTGRGGASDRPFPQRFLLEWSGWDGVYSPLNGQKVVPYYLSLDDVLIRNLATWRGGGGNGGPGVGTFVWQIIKHLQMDVPTWRIQVVMYSDQNLTEDVRWRLDATPEFDPASPIEVPLLSDTLSRPHGSPSSVVIRPAPWTMFPPET